MIIRRRHTANFTTIGNALFNDERLQADEIGIIGYLLSRPHDWEVRRPQLAKRFDYGREAIKRVVWNGMRYGWIVAQKTQLTDGRIAMIYEVRDEPGPELSDDDIRRALSLVSSEAAECDDDDPDEPSLDLKRPPPTDPPTGQPGVGQPATGNPYVDSKEESTKHGVTKDESDQNLRETRAREAKKFAREFRLRWPTAAVDDQGKLDKAIENLPEESRQACLDGIAPFLEELAKHGRKHPPAGWKYIGERKWTLLPPRQRAEAAGHVFKAWSRDWWGALLMRIALRKPATVFLELAQQNPRREWSAAGNEMPTADAIAALMSFASDGDVVAAWRPWFERHGVKLPAWRERFWVWLPAPAPPQGLNAWVLEHSDFEFETEGSTD
jgi:hypothetical protein